MISKRVTPLTQLGLGLNLSTKKTRKREFLDEMDRVVPWSALVQIVEPHSPRAKTGRPPLASPLSAAVVRCRTRRWKGRTSGPMQCALSALHEAG